MEFLCSSCQEVFNLSEGDVQLLLHDAETFQECSSMTQCAQPTSSGSSPYTDKGSVSEQSESVVRQSVSESATPEDELLLESEGKLSAANDTVSSDLSGPSEKASTIKPCVHQPVPKRAKLNVTMDLTSSLSAAPMSSHVCSVCLDILSSDFLEQLTASIIDQLSESRFIGLESFSLAIHTPLSLLIRRRMLELFVQKIKNNHQLFSNELSVKEELREMLKVSLHKRLAPLTFSADSRFQIVIYLDHETCKMDCIHLRKLKRDAFPQPKKRGRRKSTNPPSITNVSVSKALENTTTEDLIHNKSLLSIVVQQCSHKVKFLHQSLYVAGRYNKYSRQLPQTPWMVDGVKKAATSVQELISPQLLELTGAESNKFSASGREDVDVRMLGNGRPFVIELLNPHKVVLTQEELDQVSTVINKRTDLIAVHQLKEVNKDQLSKIKEGEEEKRKHYCALVWVDSDITPEELKPLENVQDLRIAQKTPIRVLHRRTLTSRERSIYTMDAKFIDSHHFMLYLCTQAGTYIKEFVHGDFGRTKPSLGTLLKHDVDILALDVENIELDWPPL